MSGALENRPQQNGTILGHVGIATSVEGNKLDLVRLGESMTHKGELRAKDSSWSCCNWNWKINSCSKSQGLGLLGLSFIYGDRFSFLLIKPLQSLDQRTGLSGEEIFPSPCPWFWLKLNCSGTLSFGSRFKYSFLQLKLSPYKPSTSRQDQRVGYLKNHVSPLLSPGLCVWGNLVKGGTSWELLVFSVNLLPMIYFPPVLLNWKIRWWFIRKYSRKDLSLLRPQILANCKFLARR